MAGKANNKTSQGNLRIIAGKHRGRKLSFLQLPGVRPTPDRVRETLFNWLTGFTEGACCLDLFCGSGALGLEAISRGAAEVTFVDASDSVIRNVRKQLKILQEPADTCCQKAEKWLAEQPAEPAFDIIFLDPPFHQNLLQPVCAGIAEKTLIKPGGYIYLEAEATLACLPIPQSWQIQKQKKTSQIIYTLCRAI